MKRDEVLELLSKTQDNNALLNRSGRFTDLLSEAIVNAVDECTDEETDEVNLEDLKDRLKYMELETAKAQREALRIFEDKEEEQNPPQTFTIEVCRTGYGFAQISVIARTIEEAEELALEEAGNYEFREKDADYKIV
jgi:hypothetical protein